MTSYKFARECAERTLDPALAVENEKIREALRKRDDKKALRLLDTEF